MMEYTETALFPTENFDRTISLNIIMKFHEVQWEYPFRKTVGDEDTTKMHTAYHPKQIGGYSS